MNVVRRLTTFASNSGEKIKAVFIGLSAVLLPVVTGLVLITDEIKTFIEGGDTLIGRIPVIKQALEDLIALFNKAKGFIFDTDFDAKLTLIKENITGPAVQKGQALINQASSSALNALSSAKSTVNSISIGDISISTMATDAESIARDVGESLKAQINNAINSFDDGVAG